MSGVCGVAWPGCPALRSFVGACLPTIHQSTHFRLPALLLALDLHLRCFACVCACHLWICPSLTPPRSGKYTSHAITLILTSSSTTSLSILQYLRTACDKKTFPHSTYTFYLRLHRLIPDDYLPFPSRNRLPGPKSETSPNPKPPATLSTLAKHLPFDFAHQITSSGTSGR